MNSDPAPGDFTLAELSYYENGEQIIKTPPFASYFVMNADVGGAICQENESEVTIKGTYDPANTTKLTLSGANSYTTQTSGSQFSVVMCLRLGSASTVLRAFNLKDTPNKNPLQLSLNLKAYMSTLGIGSATYPRPGFRSLSSRVSASVLSQTTTVTAKNLTVGDVSASAITGSGNSTLTLGVGYAPILSQVDP